MKIVLFNEFFWILKILKGLWLNRRNKIVYTSVPIDVNFWRKNFPFLSSEMAETWHPLYFFLESNLQVHKEQYLTDLMGETKLLCTTTAEGNCTMAPRAKSSPMRALLN